MKLNIKNQPSRKRNRSNASVTSPTAIVTGTIHFFNCEQLHVFMLKFGIGGKFYEQ